jgi:glycine/D-amino acid oxidase-like deaminating enzyme
MQDSVEEVGRVAQIEGLAIDWAKGGTLAIATRATHVDRLRTEVDDEHDWGHTDVEWLDGSEALAALGATGVLGASYTPHCAVLHPARLVRGLARIVESRGVQIAERTRVTEFRNGMVATTHGAVRADVIVRATEAYTPLLPGRRRDVVPLYSLVIATEPLPPAFWDEVGWRRRETLTDGGHLIIYAQRTADDRIVLGGRGAPYHFGSKVRPEFDCDDGVHAALEQRLYELFPGASGARITHRWGGPLAAPRDWHASVGLDRLTRVAWAGGYVGDGVSTSNLAGRTLADLITGAASDLTRLPWVGHRSRRWEPEPARWLGINGSLRLMASADKAEARNGRPARRAAIVNRLLGR